MASFDQLLQLIRDTSQPIATRRAAVVEIVEKGGVEAYPYLLEALSDPAPGVRREAANALKNTNYVEATSALLDAVKKEDSDLTRWSLIEALGNIGSTSALTYLETLFISELSPLTRREIQKSIDLINTRHTDTDASESVEEMQPPEELTDPAPEISESSQESHVDQTEICEEINEENTQQISVESEENIEDIQETLNERDEATSPNEEVESVLEFEDKQEDEHEVNTHQEILDPEITTETKTADTEDSSEPSINVEPQRLHTGKLKSTPSLPVLVPNTSVVIYQQEESIDNASFYAMVLRPNAYLSKRWVSRGRLYLVLLCLLLGSLIALVYSQVKRQVQSPYRANVEMEFLKRPDDYLATGSLYIQQGNYRKAIEEFEIVRGVESINTELYKNLGDAYFQVNQYAHSVEAYEYYLAAREIRPYQLFVADASYSTNSQGIDEQKSSDYKTYNTLGSAYKRLGQFDKAHQAFETAINLVPKEAKAYSNLAKLYSDGYQQRPKLTMGLAYSAKKLNPFVASSHDIVGWTLGKNDRINSATNALEQAYRLQSDYVPTLYHFSELAEKTRNPEKTLEFVQNDLRKKVLRKNISRTDILDVLSFIYEKESQKFSRFNTALYRQRGLKWE